MAAEQRIFERHKWSITDPVVQSWMNGMIWSVLGRVAKKQLEPKIELHDAEMLSANQPACLQVFQHHEVQALILKIYTEDSLHQYLGQSFITSVEEDYTHTKAFLGDLEGIFQAAAQTKYSLVGDWASRPLYDFIGQEILNPRLIRSLTFWNLTLEGRDQISRVVEGKGYVRQDDTLEGYSYKRTTAGRVEKIIVKSLLWSTTKNWNTHFEHRIWERMEAASASHFLIMEPTDQFILCARHFSINKLFNGAVDLLDLYLLAQSLGEEDMDWKRLHDFKVMFKKPFWLWTSFLALEMMEKKISHELYKPDWVKEEIKQLYDSSWYPFIESRLNWANPDTRLAEFSRAYAKLSEGK